MRFDVGGLFLLGPSPLEQHRTRANRNCKPIFIERGVSTGQWDIVR